MMIRAIEWKQIIGLSANQTTMHIQYYKPTDIIMAEYNPRQLTKDQYSQLKGIKLAVFGDYVWILNEKGEIR